MYVVSIVAYQDSRAGSMYMYTPPQMDFHTHEGLSAHAHNIVQEVEVHGWLLSGIEEDYYCLTLVANK